MSTDEASPRGSLRERTAEEIRVILARRRMSAAELARQTGIKQSTMARRMTGETAFDLDDLEVIANALGIKVSDLFRGIDRQTTAPKLQLTESTTRTRKSVKGRPNGGGRTHAIDPRSRRAARVSPGIAAAVRHLPATA